jgi:ABC-type iron transport system FetAB ATPase subunit
MVKTHKIRLKNSSFRFVRVKYHKYYHVKQQVSYLLQIPFVTTITDNVIFAALLPRKLDEFLNESRHLAG